MPFTNINITSGDNSYKYILEYFKSDTRTEFQTDYLNGMMMCDVYCDDVLFIHDNIQHIKHHNHWHNIDTSKVTSSYTPKISKEGVVRLYFPQFSVDTYHKGHKYAITISTWIRGRHIILGSYLVNRGDSLACGGIKTFFNEHYYEYIDLPIIDPMDLIYSDNWKEWRQKVCGESENPDSINSVGSLLQCTLQVVEDMDGDYIELADCVGGQSSINITKHQNDYLNLHIYSNTKNPLTKNLEPAIECKLNFNDYYDSLDEYLLETYGLKKPSIKYELVIGNEEDIYLILNSGYIEPIASYKFFKSEINKDNFDSRAGWVPGINIRCSLDIIDENNESVISLLSNTIPFSEELFKYFVKTDFYDSRGYLITNVNLDDVNMNILNINAVNKTENKIIKVDRPENSKSNIIQTSFYRVTDAVEIVVRPEVNENICINLDSYKHLVSSFILQIEGVKFIEVGRLKAGVIFKVFGNRLPKKITSGQYYILNQDFDLVTSGKYIYNV